MQNAVGKAQGRRAESSVHYEPSNAAGGVGLFLLLCLCEGEEEEKKYLLPLPRSEISDPEPSASSDKLLLSSKYKTRKTEIEDNTTPLPPVNIYTYPYSCTPEYTPLSSL